MFLVDVLSNLGELKPLMRDTKYLKLTLSFKVNEKDKRTCNLVFYDSNLLFQASLRNLSKGFAIKTPKTYFPFGFMNKEKLDFNYLGAVPPIEDFLNTISQEEYIEYCNQYKDKP
jgi:hypothetical protein